MTLVYFILALVFALLAMLASQIPVLRFAPSGATFELQPNVQWVFWVLIALSVFCVIPLFEAFLYQLHLRKLLPQFLAGMYGGATATRLDVYLARLGENTRSFVGRLVAVGAAIFATVFILSHTNAVKEKDTASYLYEDISRIVGRHQPKNVDVVAVGFTLPFPAPSNAQYLQDCLTIIQDLKGVGAKAVLVDVEGALSDMENSKWLRRIEETGIAVLGTELGSFRMADSSGEVKLSRGRLTMLTYELMTDPFLFRIKPISSRFVSDEKQLDVTLELLRKYRNYPRELEAKREKNEVIFGDYKIPVDPDGWMFARQSRIAWEGSLSVYAYRESKGDSLKFRVWSGSADARSVTGLEGVKERFNGKIVLLDRFWPRYSPILTNSYISALQAISQQTVISRSQSLHVWMTLLGILFAGWASARLRPLPSMLAIFALGFVLLLLCWFLYDRFYIFVDIFYPLLAVCMSMFVFPAIGVTERQEEVERIAPVSEEMLPSRGAK